jgi:M6 family metalloprotease-like protein
MLKHLTLLALLSGAVLAGTTSAIPPLNTKGDVYKTEGPNDPLIYGPTVGSRKAVLLFVDYPNIPQDGDTRERGDKLLAGGKFQQLFHDQSYGKFSVEVEQVHGWRRMPRENKAYDPGTTEGHREMFVDAFALYPKVNLLDYDYVMISMPGRGNFAFGERDDKAIPYRGKKINVALNQGSMSYFVLAHEFAHCMGLPDLYTYTDQVPDDAPRNPLGPWDIMSSAGRASGFIGWHRHKFGWLDDDRKTYLTQGSHKLTLKPLEAEQGISMVVVPADDPAGPSKVFVVECAQALRMEKDAPKPGGVLVYSVDATLPSGQNAVVVHPREDTVNAAFHPGQEFKDPSAPLGVKVHQEADGGGYEIEVTVK